MRSCWPQRLLDLFSWLKDNAGVRTDAFRAHFDFAERPADVLLTLCRANGLIVTQEDRHSLTPFAEEFLCDDSAWNLRPYYTPIQDSQITQDFLTVLRTGKPANWQEDDANDWHTSMLDEDFARGFTELMNCRGLAFGQKLARRWNRNWLAKNGCLMSVATQAFTPAPARCPTANDRSGARTVAGGRHCPRGNRPAWFGQSTGGAHGRYVRRRLAGMRCVTAFQSAARWDFPEVRSICTKAAAALESGGLLIIHEAFIHDDKTGPLPVAEYSALLMNICRANATPAEYGAVLAELNFEVGDYHDTIADRGFMTAVKRPV